MKLRPAWSIAPLHTWILPLALLVGCGSAKINLDDTGGSGTTDGDDTGTGGTVADGALSASPSSVDFGVFFVGQIGTQVVTVTNVGDGDVQIAASITGDTAFTVALANPAPAPGTSSDVTVAFTPVAFGDAAGELVLADTLGDADIHIPLTAQAQEDADGDGYGSVASGGEDCDDTSAIAHPGANEIWYDGIDEDCAGGDDYDRDSDGSTYDVDCDDDDATSYPGASETWYDGIDEDCLGDDDFDQDKDTFDIGDDCDDTDAAVNPSMAEIWYDGVDQDCDGIDDDQDLDGYGVSTDCNDLDAAINPGAAEVWYDGVDQDCAGDDDYDQDVDGVDYPTDCNDTDPTVTGPVAETLNGIDDDCDGAVDDVSITDAYTGVLYGDSASLGLGDADGLSLGGDVTGDGLDDLIVASDGSSSGYAWVVTGANAATAAGNVSDYDTEYLTGASTYYPLGNVVGPAMDVTGDGTGDVLIAGAGTYGSYYTYGYGYAWLETGGSALSGSVSVSSTYTARFAGDSTGDALSWAIGGDIDGDGDNDIVVGCPGDNYSTSSWGGGDYYAGNVAVFEAGTFSGDLDIGDAADQIAGSNDYDYLGSSLAVADLNADGYEDIVAGAYGQDDGADGAGAVYVFLGNATLEWDDRADDAYTARITGSGRNDYVGYYPLTEPGDVDGDGSLDLAFSTQAGGEAYLFWGAGALTGDMSVTTADITFAGTAASFGSSLAYASDLDGDGADEIYVGDSGNDTVGADAGAVYRFQPASGASGAWTSADASASFYGVSTGDALGSGLAGGGDADGDGTDDLLVGATGADGGASGGGAVYVILGG